VCVCVCVCVSGVTALTRRHDAARHGRCIAAVPSQVRTALRCLRHGGFQVVSSTVEEEEDKDDDGERDDGADDVLRSPSAREGDAIAASVHRRAACPLRRRVDLLPFSLRLLRMSRSRVHADPMATHARALLELLFLNNGARGVQHRVVSFTRTHDEISLIVPQAFESRFRSMWGDVVRAPHRGPQPSVGVSRVTCDGACVVRGACAQESMSTVWRPLEVGGIEKIGLDETGVVQSVSSLLVSSGVPIFYWSTYSTVGLRARA
jgi:hypothetical protein